jgi:mannitol/fructose-specific phosphotransferase system IIA component (Ntr-type)
MISALIESAVIVKALESPTKEGALAEMMEAMVAARRVAPKDAAPVSAQLREREALGTTGIGNGVAVPHVKSPHVSQLSLLVARSAKGIDYQAIDGKPVHTVFLIVAPVDQAEQHLKALRWVSTLARSADFRRFILSAKTDADMRDLLREMSTAK